MEVHVYTGEIPKKYKRKELKLEPVFLRVIYPQQCPFRIKDQCTLCIGDNRLMGCDVDFQMPNDCPLTKSDVVVTNEKEEKTTDNS